MTTHSATLREEIEEMIAVGELKPGQHLDETELAARFGVSRTPIRETLIQLASMGLVVIRPRRGAIVAELGPQQLVEMFEVMSELEATCGRLAARRMTPSSRPCWLRIRPARQALEAQEPDVLLQERAIPRSHLCGQPQPVPDRADARAVPPPAYRRLQLRVRDRLSNSYREHDGVVQAIIEGDGERAAQLLREHVMIQGQRFSDLMASLPQLQLFAA
jgi:DNA-binding GntR family transcriptional regulator